MKQSRPSRPKGASRAKKVSHVADAMRTPQSRSHAQQLRTDRVLTYESQSARASFWAHQQRLLQAQEHSEMDQNVAAISQGSPLSNIQFASANIKSATLESAAPALPGQATAAGLGQSGFVPPPPPGG